MSDDRITALDGLRAIAIYWVMSFHFFARYTPPLNATNFYPYGAALAEVWLVRYGYLGVQLFFLVSGFVISLTLVRCHTWQEFAIRRFARLGPPMLLASAITYMVVLWVPPHLFTVHPADFLPSLLFTGPWVIRTIFGVNCQYIDGAYWSLFVEVRFYFWAGLLYFWNAQGGFLRRSAWLMQAAVLMLGANCVWPDHRWLGRVDLALFSEFCPWLICGVAFYFIWCREELSLAWALVAEGLIATFLYHWYSEGWLAAMCVFAIFGLFGAFAVRPTAFRLLGSKWLTTVGAASYSLYLLHQNIGVTLIAAVSDALGLFGSRWSILVAVMVAVLLTVAAIACYRYYEVPSRRFVLRLGARWVSASRRANVT